MNRRAVQWWSVNLLVPVLLFSFTIYWLAEREWALALTYGLFLVASLVWIRTNWWSFQSGYARGRADTMEALARSESREEFTRLVGGTMIKMPKPWR